MHTIDLGPLHRFAVGFDRMQRQLDRVQSLEGTSGGYPPYNIEVLDEENYRIRMAVAGFNDRDIEITQQDTTLEIRGRVKDADGEEPTTYLHRGIAQRAFERRFELAEHIRVDSAELADGLLVVRLRREVPEALKPRTIEITGGGKSGKAIEHKAA